MRRNVAGPDDNVRMLKHYKQCEISRYRRNVDDVFVLLVCYAVYIGSVLSMFSLQDPPSRVKDSKKNARDGKKCGYIGESVCGDWFSGKLSDPIRKEYGGKEKRREEEQCNTRINEQRQEWKELRNKGENEECMRKESRLGTRRGNKA